MSRNEKKDNETCPVCGEGTLQPKTEMVPVDDFFINSVFSVCDSCGCSITNQEQSEKNAQAVKSRRNSREL